MFKAARSTENMPLDLFRASLETARLGEALPNLLKEYVQGIIRQAGALQAGSLDVGTTQSAAIYLYSAVAASTQLSPMADEIQQKGLGADLATQLLEAMQLAND